MSNAKSAIAAFVQSAPVAVAAPIVKNTKAKNAGVKPVVKIKAQTVPVTIPYRINNRPTSGASLFAFTQAWFELSGFINGASLTKADIAKYAGSSVVGHHTREGRFQCDGNAVSLTESGLDYFSLRMVDVRYNPADTDAFKAIMMTGKPDGKLIKNKECILKA
jgi:hypothetical protein